VNSKELVETYINAWNQRDVAGLLELMYAGAAYYDAFWMETCVGSDLAQYFQDAMDEEPFWYVQVGEVIETKNGVVFRYSAHDPDASKIGEPLHYGAEILNVVDGKILTITDMYCSSNPDDLLEVAKLAARRHGLTTHVNSGLGALKKARIRAGLSRSVDEDKVHLDPELTIAQLADAVGCTLDQLRIVIKNEFGAGIADFLDIRRVETAKELLENNPDDPDIIDKASRSAGFSSVRQFRTKFADVIGVTPTVFCLKQKDKKLTRKKPNLH
jgi:AraC-like DNA-binding protein